MVLHLYQVVFLINSSMAVDLVTAASFLVSIVALVVCQEIYLFAQRTAIARST